MGSQYPQKRKNKTFPNSWGPLFGTFSNTFPTLLLSALRFNSPFSLSRNSLQIRRFYAQRGREEKGGEKDKRWRSTQSYWMREWESLRDFTPTVHKPPGCITILRPNTTITTTNSTKRRGIVFSATESTEWSRIWRKALDQSRKKAST